MQRAELFSEFFGFSVGMRALQSGLGLKEAGGLTFEELWRVYRSEGTGRAGKDYKKQEASLGDKEALLKKGLSKEGMECSRN